MVMLAERLIGKGLDLKIYDRNVREAGLIGANRAYVETHIPHIWGLMKGSVEEVVQGSEVLVLANRSEEFADVERLRQGVRLSDFRSHFEKAWVKKRTEMRSTVLLTQREGRNREIRRVFAKLGYPVRDLRRVEYGGITERGLKVGHWRPLTRDEIGDLFDRASEERAGPPPKRPAKRSPAGSRRGRFAR